ncbi:hypothetical protein ALC62_04171, partial [Cyphomyrmex costatus]
LVFNILDLSNTSLKEESVEILGVELLSNQEKISIVNVYRHPNRDTPEKFYEDLMGYLISRDSCVLMGDFNAHHSQWGCHVSDRAGKRIMSACEDYRICIFSDQMPTLLLPPSARPSIIDLVFVTPNISPLCKVSTEEDTWGSDHFPITIKLGIDPFRRKRFVYKLNLNLEELRNFSCALSDSYISFSEE